MPAVIEACSEQTDAFDSGFPSSGWQISLKYATDFAVALVLLVLLCPIIIAAGLAVLLTSGRPVIFSQTRVGRRGKAYRIFKLRTMLHNCETLSGPCWSTPGDPRITPVGRFLRQTHLDELPQLWNVLRGEMSLVGPRPERPEFANRLAEAIPHYEKRLVIRPGVTGLAQVQLPGDTDLDSVKRKLAYDLYYVKYLNPWLDARIILGTCFKVLGVPFRKLRQWFALPSYQVVQSCFAAAFCRSWQALPDAGDEVDFEVAATVSASQDLNTITIGQGHAIPTVSAVAEGRSVPVEPSVQTART
jgi:lipopolysaccharide/colanic/teichoic acid biosynthesis glycosyltransferase